MKKYLSVSVVVLLLLAVQVTPVSALEIVIDTLGVVRVYQDGVLGDSTEEVERPAASPTRTVSPQQDKLLRVRNSGDEKSVEIIDKELRPGQEPSKLESERLRLKISASPNESDLEEGETEEREITRDVRADRVETVRQERAERVENIELRRATAASESALELRSRDISARIREQREVIIDPETNEVGIVLPSGEIKELNHLPDQAQARIDQLVANSEELELTTLPDGTVVYTTTVPKVFRFLGIFRREIDTDVTLNDSTGEIVEQKRLGTGFMGFLDSLSF